MRFLVGLLNFLGFTVCAGLMVVLYAAGGGRSWEPNTLALYSGALAYFALCFASSLPFVGRSAMAGLGFVGNIAVIPLVLVSLQHGGIEGLLFVLPFVVLTALWYVAYRGKRESTVT